MTNSYDAFRRLHQMAEEVGGVGTRVKDPLLFTKFLADSATELDNQYAPVDPNDDAISRLSREVQLLEQGHIRPEQASPDAIALLGQRTGPEPSMNPLQMASDFGRAVPQAAPWLGGATLTAMYPVSLAGSGAATIGAEKAGLGPNWQTAAGIVGGVAEGPRAVMGARKVAAPFAGASKIGKATQKLGTAERAAQKAVQPKESLFSGIQSYRASPPLPEGTVPPRQPPVTTRAAMKVGQENVDRLEAGKPIARGKRAVLDRLEMETRMGKLNPDVSEYGRDFIKAVPDKYFDRLGSSLRYTGTEAQTELMGGVRLAGEYDPMNRLISIVRNVANIADDPDRIIIHEVSHHLQSHLSPEDVKVLRNQFARVSAGKTAGVSTKNYKYTNFSEWFAETVTDKALRDYYKETPAVHGALGRAWESIQDIAQATYQWLKNRGRADEAELVYRRFLSGEQGVRNIDLSGDFNLLTPPAGAVQPPTAVEKLIRAIKTEKPMRGPTERMRSIERARRAGAGAAELERLSDPETAFQAALGKQRGQLPTAAANGLSGTDFTRDDVAQLLNQIRGHGRLRFYEKLSTRTALYKAINYAAGETDQLPGPREFELLEEVFGRDLASALQSRKGNVGRIALEIMGIPKTLRSSFDLSAPMRQGVFLSARHPKEWLEAWVPMFKSLKSDRAALESYERILADPDYQEIVGSVIPSRQRIAIVNPTGDALSMGARSANEEVFISRLTNKIPGIRASNRAYSTYLNELRYNVAKTTLNNWKKAGVDITPEKMDMLGQFINISTGRGRLGKLEQIAPALNATFWSPRLLSSRFETPTLALQALKAGDKEIARLAAEELVAFVGMGTTALTLISLSGLGRVELDPRSPDFGKIRIGGTSIDFWGGFQQMARYTAQFMTSERKPLTKDDVLVDPAKAGMEPVQRSEIAFNFLRSKLAPGVPSLLANEMTNRTFTGDKLSETVTDKRTGKKTTVQAKRPALGLKDAPEINTRLDEAIQQLVPLFGLEMTRAIENDGWQGLATTAPGVTGIGVQSIPTTDERQSSRSNWNMR